MIFFFVITDFRRWINPLFTLKEMKYKKIMKIIEIQEEKIKILVWQLHFYLNKKLKKKL